MRIINIFPIIFATLFTKAAPAYIQNPFDRVSIAPFCLGKETTIYVKGKGLDAFLRVYISNDVFDSVVIAEFPLATSSVRLKRYNNEYTRPTNEVWISYKTGMAWHSSPRITMKPISTSYRYIVDNQDVESRNNINVYSYSSDSWSAHKASYTFNNFDGMYIPDYYHKIRLEDFTISVSQADFAYFKCNPSLVISNVDGVFNDISTASSVEFPLEIFSNNVFYTFRLKDILYVNKETLKLSKVSKEGYVATKHIYLPRNSMKDQSMFKAYFAMDNFGSDNDFVRHNFELRAMKNIIGDCQNSEYCIQRL